MSSAVDAINDSYQHPELATQPTSPVLGPTGDWVGTAHHSAPLAANFIDALIISGLALPTPFTPKRGFSHLGLSPDTTEEYRFMDDGSLGTWALQK